MQWPPEGLAIINPLGLPLFNTILLLYSSYLVTYSHKAMVSHLWKDSQVGLFLAILCGIFFIGVQGYEYVAAPFSINDSVYGSVFYILTGCHGLHVLIGTIFLTVCFVRNELKHFTSDHHLGLKLLQFIGILLMLFGFLFICLFIVGLQDYFCCNLLKY